MIVSFFSNYLTHHQIPFCDAMSAFSDVKFHFVSTMPMERERKSGGWDFSEEYSYELKAFSGEKEREEAFRLAKESDVMIIGSAPEEFVNYRMKNAEFPLTIRYSERIYKGGYWRALSPRGLYLRILSYFRYITKPLYMLCASAYTAGDLAILGSYINRCFKWGYFPELKKYENINDVIKSKQNGSILWVARFISWKHPEIAIKLAKELKNQGYNFKIDMIGIGDKLPEIQKAIEDNNLTDYINLLGTMTPKEVRTQMEEHSIFLFTSDKNEGWGAVLNEAMNSGCAVVANDEIGSVPFLIEDGINGLTYHKGDFEELLSRVKNLLDNRNLCEDLGKKAYETLVTSWSAKVAAKRLKTTCESLLKGQKKFFENGPCSRAHIRVRRK